MKNVMMCMILIILAAYPTSSVAIENGARFLVEEICIKSDNSKTLSVFSQECVKRSFRSKDDIVDIGRRDWPDKLVAGKDSEGYQRSDSTLASETDGVRNIVQTFDFGGQDRRFNFFDEGKGDGGQFIVLNNGIAKILMTEDGTGGKQWFVQKACGEQDESFNAQNTGWILFNLNPDRASFGSTVTFLKKSKLANSCANKLDKSYTRWFARNVSWPSLRNGETKFSLVL